MARWVRGRRSVRFENMAPVEKQVYRQSKASLGESILTFPEEESGGSLLLVRLMAVSWT